MGLEATRAATTASVVDLTTALAADVIQAVAALAAETLATAVRTKTTLHAVQE